MGKYLIIPTQTFQRPQSGVFTPGSTVAEKFFLLPEVIQRFIAFFKRQVFVILDESSFIKTNTAMSEDKKSMSCRLIKVLTHFTSSRCILTATVMSKSPLNVVDQYNFLSPDLFKENLFEFSEHYCIMMALFAVRGRRVVIDQKTYDTVHKALVSASAFGASMQEATESKLSIRYGINISHMAHIAKHSRYTPFINLASLKKRVAEHSTFIKRKDVFSIEEDYYIYHPIMREVHLSDKGKKLGNELVKRGFNECYTLGKAPALDLLIRLQDLCNGFNPIREENVGEVTYEELEENPKLDMLRSIIEEVNTDENQIVVWCARRNALSQIMSTLKKEGICCAEYSGGVTEDEKKITEKAFESGTVRVLVASPASAAYGLNCLGKANYCVWYCINDNVADYYQAQHRLLRGESKNVKFAYTICVSNSVEEKVMTRNILGQELIGAVSTIEDFKFT